MDKYKFHRIDKEKGIDIWEAVQPELWRWEAVYNDGTILKQFEDDGIFHQFQEIDQTKLLIFRMFSPQIPQIYSVLFNPAFMKLIHFYRKTVLNAGTEQETRLKTYCFGYESNIKGETVKVINMILPNNEMITTYDIEKITIQ